MKHYTVEPSMLGSKFASLPRRAVCTHPQPLIATSNPAFGQCPDCGRSVNYTASPQSNKETK